VAADGSGSVLRGRARALTTPGGLFLAAVLLMSVIPVTSAVRDPDFWWHLRAGQLILDQRGLLGTDPFTYTVSDHHWVMHEWLTEVLFAGLHRAGGLGLIVVTLSAVTMAGIVCIALRARLPLPALGRDGPPAWRRVGPVPIGVGILLAVIAGYPIWGPRAQMETFALTCLTLYLVERHLRLGGRAVWALVPIFAIWGNLHSGFTIGAGFMGVILVTEVVAHRFKWAGRAPRERVRTLGLVLAACLAVIVLNPNGPQIYLYAFQTQFSPAQQELIQEWHSPDFHDVVVGAFELMALSLAVMVAVTRQVRPRDAALALLTIAMALQSVRHIALFIAATTPLWIEQLDAVARLRPRGRRTTPAAPGRRKEPPTFFRVGVVAIALVLPLPFVAAKVAAAAGTREDSGFYASDFPVCAARWLNAAPAGLRVFNQYGEGGYLALRITLAGDRIFIFGDAALMGDALLLRYGSVEGVSSAWNGVITQAGTDIVVFDVATPLATLLSQSPRWVEVYHDDHNAAFVPATARGDALRARLPQAVAARGSDGVCGSAVTTAVGPAVTAAARSVP
jgi:hypothetical protein